MAYDGDTPFPSLHALAPVGGTALIVLFAGPGTPVGRLLSMPAFVGIGLISYSAYLWHQPLFAFARIRGFGHVEDWLMLTLAAASLALAWFSWRYVEQPFRRGGGWLPARRAIFAASGAGMAAFIALGLAGHVTNGFFAQKTTSEQIALLQAIEKNPHTAFCHEYERRGRQSEEPCVYHDGPVRWAVLGNSHGTALAYALADALRPRNEALMHFTVSSCRPAFGLAEELGFCGRWTDDTVQQIVKSSEIEHVVLSYRTLSSTEAMIDAYMNMARFLQEAGKTVVLVLEVPNLPVRIERLVYSRSVDAQGNIRGQARAAALAENSDVRAAVERLPSQVIVVDPAEVFCDQTTCYGVLDGWALFTDDNHMSLHGAGLVTGQILSAVDRRTADSSRPR